MSQTDRSRMLEILKAEAVQHGDFVLASGARSKVYLDCRCATLHPEGATLAGRLILEWMVREGISPDCIGGPTLGADPIVAAVVVLSHQRGAGLPGFLVRKEAKGHGTGRAVEGQFRAGWSAVMVEDTVTTGQSLLAAIRRVEEVGMRVIAVTSLVDRDQGAAEALAGFHYDPIFTWREVMEQA